MSQWGVIRDDEGNVHIAPLLRDGSLDLRHSLHEFCQCGVREELVTADVSIWIHIDPERGGR